MKVKVSTGAGMRGLVKYQVKDGSEFVSGSQPIASDFLRETAALRELRPDCRKPVLHFSLSQPPGEALSNDQWAQVADSFLQKMGLENNSHFVVRHTDSDHDHIHIACNKIGHDGRLWDTNKSAKKGMQACSDIEHEMSLTVTKTLDQHRQQRAAGAAAKPMSDGVLRQFARSGTVPNKTKDAIARRIKNERENANRTAHQVTGGDDGRLVDQQSGADQDITRPDAADRSAGKTGNSPTSRAERGFEPNRGTRDSSETQVVRVDENQNRSECWIEGIEGDTSAPAPCLAGRLHPRPCPSDAAAHDLYWQGRDRPTYRWHQDSGQLQMLARPSETGIRALFDLARESGLQPPLRIFGTQDFQRQACDEARRRGIEVRPASETVAREHDRALEPQRAAERARINAERAAAERARLEKIIAEEDRQKAERAAERSKSKPTMRM